ncbi:hypothetical protein H9Q13_05320 [Pontibacter sp. JH31]|uniref:Uncharacterized protein n=1 Tax=Pontibacter aquaedesilientis TaxID=2766980 RepID=A0ABR7XE53_9BACT|nr:hypothetical protein [Pontibacter aquaedesilientis]MBD1396578.1 hypothetical protein [Pontibacter aquaedesilientis]
MNTDLQPQESSAIKTECGKEFGHLFKAIKLVQDERHNFHIVYKTYSNQYIYSFCNPFQDTSSGHAYKLISEKEAKTIFLDRLSPENARELFYTAQAPIMRTLS